MDAYLGDSGISGDYGRSYLIRRYSGLESEVSLYFKLEITEYRLSRPQRFWGYSLSKLGIE